MVATNPYGAMNKELRQRLEMNRARAYPLGLELVRAQDARREQFLLQEAWCIEAFERVVNPVWPPPPSARSLWLRATR